MAKRLKINLTGIGSSACARRALANGQDWLDGGKSPTDPAGGDGPKSKGEWPLPRLKCREACSMLKPNQKWRLSPNKGGSAMGDDERLKSEDAPLKQEDFPVHTREKKIVKNDGKTICGSDEVELGRLAFGRTEAAYLIYLNLVLIACQNDGLSGC
jgi:hypothetical protein